MARVVPKFPSIGAVQIEADSTLVERWSNGDPLLVVDVAHGAVDVIVGVDGLAGGVHARETKVDVGGGVEATVQAFKVNHRDPGTAKRVEGGKGVVLDFVEDNLAELRGETRIVAIIVVAKLRRLSYNLSCVTLWLESK